MNRVHREKVALVMSGSPRPQDMTLNLTEEYVVTSKPATCKQEIIGLSSDLLMLDISLESRKETDPNRILWE